MTIYYPVRQKSNELGRLNLKKKKGGKIYVYNKLTVKHEVIIDHRYVWKTGIQKYKTCWMGGEGDQGIRGSGERSERSTLPSVMDTQAKLASKTILA